MTHTVVGLFDSITDAQRVIRDLQTAGFSRDNISLVANDADSSYGKYVQPGTTDLDDDVTADEGAGFGAVVGALTGALIGLGALALPGIGPVLAAGPLLGALGGGAVGAVAGAATGGLVAALVKTGIPEEHAQHYAEGVRRGGTLLMVMSPDDMAQKAVDILQRNGAINIHERSEEWRRNGWTAFDPNAAPYSSTSANEATRPQRTRTSN